MQRNPFSPLLIRIGVATARRAGILAEV